MAAFSPPRIHPPFAFAPLLLRPEGSVSAALQRTAMTEEELQNLQRDLAASKAALEQSVAQLSARAKGQDRKDGQGTAACC